MDTSRSSVVVVVVLLGAGLAMSACGSSMQKPTDGGAGDSDSATTRKVDCSGDPPSPPPTRSARTASSRTRRTRRSCPRAGVRASRVFLCRREHDDHRVGDVCADDPALHRGRAGQRLRHRARSRRSRRPGGAGPNAATVLRTEYARHGWKRLLFHARRRARVHGGGRRLRELDLCAGPGADRPPQGRSPGVGRCVDSHPQRTALGVHLKTAGNG